MIGKGASVWLFVVIHRKTKIRMQQLNKMFES